MGSAADGFSRELLNQPWSARIQSFQTYTMAHPRLVAVRDALLSAIHEVPCNSLILVLGPTGVGKTTLRAKVEQLLTSELMPVLEVECGRLAVVSVECIAPESGSFNWRDHFRRLLLQMEEPLIDYKINPEAPVWIGNRVLRFMPSARAVGAEYRHAVERALAFRRPAAVLIDEAQHLARVGSGRRLSEQLDVIKSLANRTKTVHVLIGTYELLAFRNLSAQLSRRSIDIHFARYRADHPDDLKAFRTIVKSFEHLYERSIGCVGVLKDWLVRALISLSRRNADSLTRKDLEAHAPGVAQCEKMLSEALEGETNLLEGAEARRRLRTRLGLRPAEDDHEDLNVGDVARPAETAVRRRQQRKPGRRTPVRDAVGVANFAYANTAHL
jgi:energy-coupling factor transporter ATP-binding protein EcfA2